MRPYGSVKSGSSVARLQSCGKARLTLHSRRIAMKGKAICALAVAVGVAFAAAHTAAASAASVVWVQTNQPTGNSIVVYDRGSDGRLTRAGIYATGGDGGVAAPGSESDHLGSQGS